MKAKDLHNGQVVFFSRVEEVWNRPIVKKRHHVYDTRSIILRGIVVNTQGDQFQATLEGNNGFEKDGETFVFHEGSLLSNQDFKDTDDLGKWKYSDLEHNRTVLSSGHIHHELPKGMKPKPTE